MRLQYIKNVTTLDLNREKCTGCGMCQIVCPQGVFSLENGKAELAAKDFCMECGACMMNCSFEAVTVKKGVGCAAGIIQGALRGTEPNCDCGGGGTGCCNC